MPWVKVLLIVGWLCCAARAELIWWEGEKPAATNFPRRSDFAPTTFPQTRQLLSEGNWLSASGKRRGEELFAQYDVQVLADGTYDLWARKFWNHGPFRWRFDEGEWHDVGTNLPLADNVSLRTHLNANWVYLGEAKLSKGGRKFEIRLSAKEGESIVSGFDCFVLTDGPFVPNGNAKTFQKSGRAEAGYFAYEPSIDSFDANALLDLRSLNEPVAGQNGFVQRRGNEFALGDGKPVRFWSVNCSVDNVRQNPRSIDYLARRLAKAGVNMVRVHGKMWHDSDPTKLDERIVSDLQRFVLAMKKQGIYSSISIYFPLWMNAKDSQGLEGFDANQNKKPFSLLFFNPTLQKWHRQWLKQLLETPGENGAPPLGHEPAVAIVELLNEDSTFFWTFTKKNIPPAQWEMLENRYHEWLEKKGVAGEKPALMEIWNLTSAGIKGDQEKRKRAGDQARFMAELQKAFYDQMIAEMRQAGAKNLFVCSNWMTADHGMLDAIERWTNTGGDLIEHHGYFGGKHEGDGASYSVRVGHKFEDAAAVLTPERLPLRWFHVEGLPTRMSEIGWELPNHLRGDAAFLASAYASLQGLDAIDWFIVGNNYLMDNPGGKFNVGWPSMFATFPAAAMVYRQGLVKEAPDVVHRVVAVESMFEMKSETRVDPLAFYVGRVTREFGDDASKTRELNAAEFIDRHSKVVRSMTGELNWDWGNGLAKVDAPAVQGAAGFLKKAGRIELKDVVIESANEHGQLMLVAMDGKPLAESRRVLVQVMTEEKPFGEKSDGGAIAALGTYPIGVKLVDTTIQIKSWGGKVKLQRLDENGYAVDAPIELSSDQIKLPESALHCILSR